MEIIIKTHTRVNPHIEVDPAAWVPFITSSLQLDLSPNAIALLYPLYVEQGKGNTSGLEANTIFLRGEVSRYLAFVDALNELALEPEAVIFDPDQGTYRINSDLFEIIQRELFKTQTHEELN